MSVKDNALRVSYGQSQPLVQVFNAPIVSVRSPTNRDFAPLGQVWVNKLNGNAYMLTQLINNAATWTLVAMAVGGAINQFVTTDDGAVVLPAGGTVNFAGDLTNISVTGGIANTVTIALVNSPTILGNLTVNGSITSLGGQTITGAFVQSAGNVTINDDAAGATIKIGTGAAAKLVSVGSANGASSLTLRSGSGNTSLTSTGTITSNAAGLNTVTSTANAPGAVTIRANGGAAETVIVSAAQGTGNASVNINSVAGGVTLNGGLGTAQALNLIANSAGGGLTSTVSTGGYSFTAANGIFTANTGTGTVSVSTDATANTVNLGTGAGVKLVTLGSIVGASNTVVRSGSAGVNVNVSNNQPTNINTGTSTGTVSIGSANAGGVIILGPTSINNTGLLNTLIGAGGNTGTVSIGSAASTAVDIAGPVFINDSVNKNTQINTGTSTGTVTIGTLVNAGGVSINSAAASNMSVSGAGVDLTLSSVLGSVIVSATEVDPAAIQLTTAATGGITVNASSAAMLVHRAVNVDAAAGVDAFTSTSLTTGIAGIFTSSASTVDAVRLLGGGLRVTPSTPGAAASPIVSNARFGSVPFTDIIGAGATVALTITNSLSLGTSVVLATAQCATVGSACVIRDIDVSVAGSITCNVTNLGAAPTALDVVINYWLLN